MTVCEVVPQWKYEIIVLEVQPHFGSNLGIKPDLKK